METELHAIGNLRAMEVIDISNGAKLGYIRDLKIDCSEYKIISILLPNQKVTWFSKNDSIEIPWSKVVKIGIDVILVDGSNISGINKE
jgi:YlmC/YmxH family sporulation protein